MITKRSIVSVALCSYNGGRYIRAQLESMLIQSRRPDEIVVADDHSEDDTREIVADVASREPAVIRLICNAVRLGVTRNFEQAIAQTHGDIVFLSDQDDVWRPDRVYTMLRPFEKDPRIGLVFSDAILVDAELNPTPHRFFPYLGLTRYRNPSPAQMIKTEGEMAGCLVAFRARLKPVIVPPVDGWTYDLKAVFLAYATSMVKRIDESLMLHRRHSLAATGEGFFRRKFTDQLRAARNAGMTEIYAEDRRQWEAMAERLHALSAKPEWVSNRLEATLRECKVRLAFARERERLRRLSPIARMPLAFRALARGHYHRYLRGFKSIAKDCIL